MLVRWLLVVCCSVLLLGVCAPSLAQEGEAGLLSGPAVDAQPTIVRYRMDGSLEPIAGRPEIAAAQVLIATRSLPADAARRVRDITAARGEAVRMLLVDELDTVREVTDFIQAGETDAARDAMRALWQRFEPGAPYAPLMPELAEAVGDEHAVELERINEAYWEALLRERASGMMDDRRQAAIAAARERLAFQIFQQELREAYDLTLRRYRELLESIDAGVDPTDAQREAIREIVLDHIKRTRLSATPGQRRETMLAIYRVLDPSRREKLYGLMLRQVIPD
ncbi:hypothetical protein AY599_13550 [Leptolyngbya valderiana BDU 20041]|nr:hypothetical protein AY599_13550 [Leptolyngbya valderiana BDU 20041]